VVALKLSPRFWLFAMDALAACGLFGSRAYLWCVGRASDCTDWGEPVEPTGEEPF